MTRYASNVSFSVFLHVVRWLAMLPNVNMSLFSGIRQFTPNLCRVWECYCTWRARSDIYLVQHTQPQHRDTVPGVRVDRVNCCVYWPFVDVLQSEGQNPARMCSCRRMRSVDCAWSPGRSFSVNPFCWSWRPPSRFVVHNIYTNQA